MGLIRHLAVKSYENEMKEFVSRLSQLSIDQRGQLLVYSVWLRAILHKEGHLRVGYESSLIDPELSCYPTMLGDLEKVIRFTRKNAEHGKAKAIALSIWIHSIRAILRPELNQLAQKMWALFQESKPNWDKWINDHETEDLQLGHPRESVLQTAQIAKSIISVLPPKQIVGKGVI